MRNSPAAQLVVYLPQGLRQRLTVGIRDEAYRVEHLHVGHIAQNVGPRPDICPTRGHAPTVNRSTKESISYPLSQSFIIRIIVFISISEIGGDAAGAARGVKINQIIPTVQVRPASPYRFLSPHGSHPDIYTRRPYAIGRCRPAPTFTRAERHHSLIGHRRRPERFASRCHKPPHGRMRHINRRRTEMCRARHPRRTRRCGRISARELLVGIKLIHHVRRP